MTAEQTAAEIVRAYDEVLLPEEQATLREAIASALRRQSPEAAWQPIATAPKDGTEVLLTDMKTYRRVGNWARLRNCWAVDAVVSLAPATHWMPLPAAPGSTPTQETEKP